MDKEYKRRFVALWPTKNTIKFLEAAGAEQKDLHMTCYYSGQESNIFDFDAKCLVKGKVIEVVHWPNADAYVARIKVENDVTKRLSKTFEEIYGPQEFEHNPHITLTYGGKFKDSYKKLIGLTVAFDRFSTKQPD